MEESERGRKGKKADSIDTEGLVINSECMCGYLSTISIGILVMK